LVGNTQSAEDSYGMIIALSHPHTHKHTERERERERERDRETHRQTINRLMYSNLSNTHTQINKHGRIKTSVGPGAVAQMWALSTPRWVRLHK